MRRIRCLSRGGRLLLVVVVGGAAFGIASAVQASIPDAGGVIHGCYNTSLAHGSPTGALRVIDTAKTNGNCASWEAPLTWNQTGPTGATGPTGPTGPTGATGPSDGGFAHSLATIPTGGGVVPVASITNGLPAGDYLVTFAVNGDALASGSADLRCNPNFLNDPGGSTIASIDAKGGATTASGFSLTATTHLQLTGTGGFEIVCREGSGSVAVDVEGSMVLTRVATLHS